MPDVARKEGTLNQSALCADYLLGLDVQGGPAYKVMLCCVGSNEIMYFNSLGESLLWMNRQMDYWQYPHTDTQLRSFGADDAKRREADGEAGHPASRKRKQDPYAPKRLYNMEDVPKFPQNTTVFHIRILYRQHSSWQGQIIQMRQRPLKEEHFRSILELLNLIRSAFPNRMPSAEPV